MPWGLGADTCGQKLGPQKLSCPGDTAPGPAEGGGGPICLPASRRRGRGRKPQAPPRPPSSNPAKARSLGFENDPHQPGGSRRTQPPAPGAQHLRAGGRGKVPEGGGFNSGSAHWLGPGRLGGHCLVSADAPSSREIMSFSRPLRSYLASIIAVGQCCVNFGALCWPLEPSSNPFCFCALGSLDPGFRVCQPYLGPCESFVFEDICGCDRFVVKTLGELWAERATRRVLYIIQ